MTAGCDSDRVFPETFQPNGTYVAQDLNQPSVTRGTFTTLSSGSAAPVTVTYGGGTAKAESQSALVGSLSLKGTLHATVTAGGALKLLNAGKAVSKLTAGRYKFAISDQDAKASFTILGPTFTAPKSLTSTRFKGTHSVIVSLTSGKWSYFEPRDAALLPRHELNSLATGRRARIPACRPRPEIPCGLLPR